MPLVWMAGSAAFGWVKGYFHGEEEEQPSTAITVAKYATAGLAAYGGYHLYKKVKK